MVTYRSNQVLNRKKLQTRYKYKRMSQKFVVQNKPNKYKVQIINNDQIETRKHTTN